MPDPPLVLVADAHPGVNRMVAEWLTRAGYRTRTADGPAAVPPALPPGTALLVVGGDGGGTTAAGVAAALRGAGDRTPVLLLSGWANPAADALAGADPTVRVLSKPFALTDLGRAVRDLLAG